MDKRIKLFSKPVFLYSSKYNFQKIRRSSVNDGTSNCHLRDYFLFFSIIDIASSRSSQASFVACKNSL